MKKYRPGLRRCYCREYRAEGLSSLQKRNLVHFEQGVPRSTWRLDPAHEGYVMIRHLCMMGEWVRLLGELTGLAQVDDCAQPLLDQPCNPVVVDPVQGVST